MKLRDIAVIEELLIPDMYYDSVFILLELFPLIPDTFIQYFNTRGLFSRFKLSFTKIDLG